MSGSEEGRVLDLALRRGVLAEGDLLSVADAARESSATSLTRVGPYGPRLDRLIALGRIEPRQVKSLLDELAAQNQTIEGVRPSAPPEISSASDGELVVAPSLSPDPGLSYLLRWDRYAIETRLGQGGMGVVYRAVDKRLHRTVALKFMRKTDAQTTQRFLREARAQARIRHPAVCQIFDAGEYAGFPYIAMEYLPGRPLNLVHADLSLTQKIWIAREVAGALHAAHSMDIVHRDIKPQNILAHTRTDGQWQASVLDFGLALDVAQLDSLTESGAIIGTPAYMSPEQAAGGTVDRRSDIYGLGAVLYQLLTGEPPFSGRSPAEVLHRVLKDDPVPPRKRQPSIPRELELITLKCLRKEPRLRYESAQALADDLDRYLAGEPLSASRGSWLYRLRQGVRRHRVLVSLGTIAMTGLGGDAAISLRERQLADQRARLAHDLGREVELSELFLRSSYLLPLHNIRIEQAEVHARILRIKSQLPTLDRAEAARAHHALGRAYLALRSYALAAQHLQAALPEGRAALGVHYDLGLALGSLYQSELRDVERQGDPAWRARREKELRAQYLEPAQAHFRSFQDGSPERMESPEYADAIMAFFDHDEARAIERADAALRKQPWRYEARRLIADTYYQRGLRGIERRSYTEARADLRSALDHYQEAAAVAQSDPALHLSTADAWRAYAQLDMLQGAPPQASLEQALAACERLARSDPEDGRRYFIEHVVHFSRVYYLLQSGVDPDRSLQQALDAAQHCIRMRPQDPLCRDGAGAVWGLRASLTLAQGREAEEPLNRAQTYHRQAVELNPHSARLWNGRGAIQLLLGKQQILRGLDGQPSFDAALADFRKARQLSPEEFTCNETLFRSMAPYAEFTAKQGRSVQRLLNEAQEWSRSAREQGCHTATTHETLAQLYIVAAAYERSQGHDPKPLQASAATELAEALKLNPESPESHRLLALLYRMKAR